MSAPCLLIQRLHLAPTRLVVRLGVDSRCGRAGVSGLILDESEVFLDVVLKYSVAGFIAKINRESSAVTYPLLYFIFFKK